MTSPSWRPVIWSKLSGNIAKSQSISTFKKQLRKVDKNELLKEECQEYPLCNRWIIIIVRVAHVLRMIGREIEALENNFEI